VSASGARHTTWQRAPLVAGLLLGVWLIVMAGPRFVAALLDGPGDRVQFYLLRGADVTDEALRGLIAARRSAAAWHQTAEGQRDIAEATLQRIHRGEHASAFTEAEQAVRESLAMAPVDPHSWARLAHIAWRRDRNAATATKALRASVQVGAYEPSLTAWRVRLTLELWNALAAADRSAFATQIRQLGRDEPDTLAQLTADPQAARIIEDAVHMADRIEAERPRRLR
jgi:hypothetical protein